VIAEDTDLISVYIITHNRFRLLKRSLESVRNQLYKNLEIIVVDDFSRDETSQYVKQKCNEDKRIIYVRNEKNMGACYSRNIAIQMAKGKYITGLDDDDYFLPERVLDFHNNADKINGDICLLYTDSIWKTARGLNKAKINRRFNTPISYDDLLAFNFIGNQIFTMTDLLKKYQFDVNMPAWQDLECWINILKGENKKGLKIEAYNYVQDISHEHERISSSKHEKIEKAYINIKLKYNLTLVQSLLLENHFSSYGIKSIKYILSSTIIIVKYKINGVLIAVRNLREMIRCK